MYHKQIVMVLVSLSAAWLLGDRPANGQTTQRTSDPSLVERIDGFGQKVVDGIFSRLPGSKKPLTRQQEQRLLDEGSQPRAGSSIRPAKSLGAAKTSTSTTQRRELFPLGLDGIIPGSGENQSGSTPREQRESGSASQATPSPYGGYPTREELTGSKSRPSSDDSGRRMLVGVSPPSAPDEPRDAQPQPTPQPVGLPASTRSASSVPVLGGLVVRNTTIAENQPKDQPETTTSQPSSSAATVQPLHERLARFRQSVFGNPTPRTEPADAAPEQTARRSTVTAPTSRKESAAAGPTVVSSRQAERRVPTVAPSQPTPPSVDETGQESTPVVGPSLTERAPTRAPQRPDEPTASPAAEAVADSGPSTPVDSAPAAPAEETRVASQAGEQPEADEQILLSRRSPILDVRTLGPARIAVGKQSTYEIHVENLGDVAADDVVVTMALPDWADVVAREATSGAILDEPAADGSRQLLWRIGPMEAKVRQKATLAIVPRESRPIDLAVRWDFTPITSQTVIQVEEPRLNLRLAGPREVRFGEPQVFKLEISNSGNGDADDVVLALMPLVPGEGGPTQHRLGTLAAGERKVIDMELIARQPGSLAVRMELRCDGPARASLNETLLVRKANVEVAIEAPKMQFTGTVATYRIRVRNSGNMAAENIRLVAKIPPEAKFLAANHEGKATANGQAVQWKLDRIAEGTEQELLVRCQLAREGYMQMKVEALGKKVAAEATAVTRVESIADLALEVSDPPGPVPLGQTADYTVTIHNRGTRDASGVEAVVYFSQGIEPVSAKGAPYKLAPGQVLFDSIGVVPAGKKVVLSVVGKAQVAGNHMFRAEVYCRPLGTKLVGEETTHFYQGDFELPSQRPMLGTTTPIGGENPTRTADLRNQEPVAPPPTGDGSDTDGSTPMRY